MASRYGKIVKLDKGSTTITLSSVGRFYDAPPEPPPTDFKKVKMAYGTKSIAEIKKSIAKKNKTHRFSHATAWKNRRPICPYGCGQEGELVEIVLKDNKALGIYRDSEQLMFTADLQMSPKPTGRRIVIGPDGEPTMAEEV